MKIIISRQLMVYLPREEKPLRGVAGANTSPPPQTLCGIDSTQGGGGKGGKTVTEITQLGTKKVFKERARPVPTAKSGRGH